MSKIEWEFAPDAKVSSDDFFYDLFDGGYIKPEVILSKQEQIDKVTEAMDVLQSFKEAIEESDFFEEM